jgi:hypothetical protein
MEAAWPLWERVSSAVRKVVVHVPGVGLAS